MTADPLTRPESGPDSRHISGSSGVFVAFEGGEGVGKSTQIARAAAWLRTRGREVIETREPGGTALGQELRRLVLDPDGHVTHRAEALLYAADRAHHVETVIRPALAAGHVVLTDRYVDSTLAYQGTGRGLSVDQARVITDWATGGLLPDLTVLLDLDPATGLARAGARSRPDRLEGASLAFHEAVRASFLALAAEDPGRYLVVDAARGEDEIAEQITAALAAFG
jgi:dTMP kinase